MKPIYKKISWALLASLIVLQFYRPQKNVSELPVTEFFENETQPPAPILATLQENCYNCHSNNTEYPWYNEIAPLSIFIDEHIKDGKKHLNFSDWASYSTKKKDHKMEELAAEVLSGEMPLKSYTWTHGNISEEQAQGLVAWAERNRVFYEYKMKYREDQSY